jgi:malonate-semialdehyde dehydrogenase (acetylating)/methylmalonate-semialdehyde dehydrogenase
VPFSSATDIDEAVETGQEAFEEWSATAVEERIQPLFRLKRLLEEHQDELAELLVEDYGKTVAEARGEIRRGIENVEVACGIPSMMQGGSLRTRRPTSTRAAFGSRWARSRRSRRLTSPA